MVTSSSSARFTTRVARHAGQHFQISFIQSSSTHSGHKTSNNYQLPLDWLLIFPIKIKAILLIVRSHYLSVQRGFHSRSTCNLSNLFLALFLSMDRDRSASQKEATTTIGNKIKREKVGMASEREMEEIGSSSGNTSHQQCTRSVIKSGMADPLFNQRQ